MDPKKTQPGQRFQFSASLYNDLIDVVKWAKTQRGLAGAAQTGMRSTPTTVLVKNESGAAVPQYGCLEVSNTVGTGLDFENLKALRGVKPTASLKPVVIVQATAQSDEVAESVVAGTTMAKVDVKSTSDTHAEPVSGSTTLRSGTAGRFRILHPLTSTGVQNVMVRFESAGAAKSLPQVKNRSGYTVPPWGFLVVDGTTPLPSVDLPSFQASPVLQGYGPSGNFNGTHKRLVSVPGGAAPNETVDCVIDGFVPARIYSQTVNNPTMAHATANDGVNNVTRLSCYYDQTHFGLPIIYREPGTGEKWGLVDLTPMNQPGSVIGLSALNRPAAATLGEWQTFNWIGNPWSTKQVIQNSGTVVVEPNTNVLSFGTNSSWMGDVTVSVQITYSNLPVSNGLARVPGYEIQVGVENAVSGTPGTIYSLPARLFKVPTLASSLDGITTVYDINTLVIPFAFQSSGTMSATTGLRLNVSCRHIGGSGSGRVTFELRDARLIVHEVDPLLLKGASQSSGVISGGGTVSSAPVKDPLAGYSSGVKSASGSLMSGGLASARSSTGFGIE